MYNISKFFKDETIICWYWISRNPNAIHIIEKNLDKIDWIILSSNPNAISILEKNLDKVNWVILSSNPNAIHIIERNPDKIIWKYLSENPNAIHLLENNQDKIQWYWLLRHETIFELDYSALKERYSIYKDELLEIALHPSRIKKLLDSGIEMGDFDNYI